MSPAGLRSAAGASTGKRGMKTLKREAFVSLHSFVRYTRSEEEEEKPSRDKKYKSNGVEGK